MTFDEFLQFIRKRLPYDKNDDAYWSARYSELSLVSIEGINKELPYLAVRAHANRYGVDLYNAKHPRTTRFKIDGSPFVWREY